MKKVGTWGRIAARTARVYSGLLGTPAEDQDLQKETHLKSYLPSSVNPRFPAESADRQAQQNDC
jgi:hypothetical protein